MRSLPPQDLRPLRSDFGVVRTSNGPREQGGESVFSAELGADDIGRGPVAQSNTFLEKFKELGLKKIR